MVTYQSAVKDAVARYGFPSLPGCIENAPTLASISANVVGPVLLSYVWWILREAKKRKLKCLYFLARDGYVLREIAAQLCQQFALDIECRYLYCSRMALRMPGYWFLGEEAFDLLLQGGYFVSVSSILSRIDMSAEEREILLGQLGISQQDLNKGMNQKEFAAFTAQLRKNEFYRTLVVEKSKNAYPAAIGYLRQEGLLDQEQLAIVDSGWVGSMQRSLRKLLQQAGWKGTITGFYFGMLEKPADEADGIYLAWYFDYRRGKREKIQFCNNLFECMLSAPHGMTKSYRKEGTQFFPVLDSFENARMESAIHTQIQSILTFVQCASPTLRLDEFDNDVLHTMSHKLLCRLMYCPTKQDTAAYEEFVFSDDITDIYETSIVNKMLLGHIQDYLLIPRIVHKVFPSTARVSSPEPFWIYGTIAYLPKRKQLWYRINIYLWEWLRYTLKSMRRRK